MQSFIDSGEDVKATDRDGDTLLIKTAILGYTEIPGLLILSGVDENIASSADEVLAGYTPLIRATA